MKSKLWLYFFFNCEKCKTDINRPGLANFKTNIHNILVSVYKAFFLLDTTSTLVTFIGVTNALTLAQASSGFFDLSSRSSTLQ